MKKLLFLVCFINYSYTMTSNCLASRLTLRQRVFAKYTLNSLPIAFAVYNIAQGNPFTICCGLENACCNPDVCRLALSLGSCVAECIDDTTPYCNTRWQRAVKNYGYMASACSFGYDNSYSGCFVRLCLGAGNSLARSLQHTSVEISNTTPGQEAMEV